MRSIRGSTVAIALLAATAAISGPAAGQEGWLVRARAVRLVPADESSAIPALGVPGDAIDINSKTIPDVDVSYFMTPNFALELVLTVPQKQRVSIDGVGRIGSFRHLPPTLLAQYHFLPDSQFSPYVGAGINYTLIYHDRITVPGVGNLRTENSSVGPAVQIGADYHLDRNWLLNVDFKYIGIRTDVKLESTATKVTKVKVDPFLFGIGIGYRF
jgi:outer membrane protein